MPCPPFLGSMFSVDRGFDATQNLGLSGVFYRLVFGGEKER